MDLRLEGGKIAGIAPSAERVHARGAEAIDLEGRVAIPGFVDAHMHLDKGMVSARAVNRSGTLAEALRRMKEAKKDFGFEDTRRRARRQIEMAIGNGTTAIRTHVDIDFTVGLVGIEALRALREQLQGAITLQLVALPHGDLVSSRRFLRLFRRAIELSDLIGGIPRPGDRKSLDRLFDLAREFDRDLDLHVDETDAPTPLAIRDVARKTMKVGFEGRVTVGHLCALSSLPPRGAQEMIARIRDAGINVITLPSTNLHLQGRADARSPRRGITRVKEMLAAGIPVAYASDNIRDGFNPFGNADMMEVGLLLAHGAQMGTPNELLTVLDMGTETAGRIFYRRQHYGLRAGHEADLVVLDTKDLGDAIVCRPTRRWVFKGGKLVARTSARTELFL